MKNNKSWLHQTKQFWKWRAYNLLLAVGAISLIFMIHYLESDRNVAVVASGLTSAFLGVLSLLWLAYSIQCPACRKKIGIYFITKVKFGTWMEEIESFEKCPYCGHPGDQGNPKPNE